MKKFSEAEKQLLIAVGWLKSRYGAMSGFDGKSHANALNLRKFGEIWFGKYLVDWTNAFESLTGGEYLLKTGKNFALTEKGNLARQATETENPLWLYEYNNFFAAAEKSKAHALFCEKVYGRNLCQHGLADVFQLNKLLEVLKLKMNERVLDLGCGNGFITEYLQKESGAYFQGVDISEEAIRQAQARATTKRLAFSVGNMNHLNFKPHIFDCVVAIDTLYYVDDLEETLKQMLAIIKPEGRMGIFFTQWIDDAADIEKLHHENTDLAVLLGKYDLKFSTLNLTENEAKHWRRKVSVLEELEPQFEAEDNLELYNYRYAEAARYADWDSEKRSRYLYHISLSEQK
jgi:ubiquinone/menaquinone biosynthesis C-methylase UbiE